LSGAKLPHSYFTGEKMKQAILRDSNLDDSFMESVDLTGADLRGASLRHANLSCGHLNRANLSDADISSASIWGIQAWDVRLDGAKQRDLHITGGPGSPYITTDNLEMAQLIYFLWKNESMRGFIDTVTSKVVLILGRFTEKRKMVLDDIRASLRDQNYLPVMFDFEPSESRDLVETIELLARMARFVIADVTDAKVVLQELEITVPRIEIPYILIIEAGHKPSITLSSITKFPWVLPLYAYPTVENLLNEIKNSLAPQAETMAFDLNLMKAQRMKEMREFRVTKTEVYTRVYS
jgi:hypothetical protein